MPRLFQPRYAGIMFLLLQGAAAAAPPTIKQMQYTSHWDGETDPWANITATVTPPDSGTHLPSSIHVRLDTVYVLGSRKDLFCHIQDYFVFSMVTKLDGAGWQTLATKAGTTTGCPNANQPSHVVEFDIPVPAGDGQHSLVFHLYSDGRAGFCPRPDSDNKASMRVSGTVGWSSATGTLQTSNVTIDDLAQPHGLDGCPDANSENDRFPDRVIPRPADIPRLEKAVYADSSKGVRTEASSNCCSACNAIPMSNECCIHNQCNRWRRCW
jgi:hypothetical protein